MNAIGAKKGELGVGGFYGSPDEENDLSANNFLARQKARDQKAITARRDKAPAIFPATTTPSTFMPTNMMTSLITPVGINEVVDQHMFSRSNLLPDYGHP